MKEEAENSRVRASGMYRWVKVPCTILGRCQTLRERQCHPSLERVIRGPDNNTNCEKLVC